jgi:hypothetical protein
MTKQEAAIVTAYTRKMLGDFSYLHAYIEKIMGRPVWTHEMGSKDIALEISQKAKQDFINITIT